MPALPKRQRAERLGAIPVLDVLFVVGFVGLFAAFVLMAGAVEKL
ncbi:MULTISPECIES: hypothetical protein [unclassified Arthrobacter]|nr:MULTISPECIES: hypothetical protein [unclassified Arthrobacter]UWX86438.1 hypothetical protein N2K99_07985 [Arthrobacter sp. zg-Y1110]